MTFTDLITKLASGQPLSENDKFELTQQARRLDDAAALLYELIRPGTKLLRIDGLETNDAVIANAVITDATITDATITTATITDATITTATITDAVITSATIDSTTTGGGDVSMDDDGIWVKNQMAAFGFEDTSNQRFNLYVYSSSDDDLGLINHVTGKGIVQTIKLASGAQPSAYFKQDADQDNRTQFHLEPGTQGTKISLDDFLALFSKGSAGGSTHIYLDGFGNITPPSPNGTSAHVYVKGSRLIFQYLDGATIRYKYLDLAGTGVTWVHTTTAP